MCTVGSVVTKDQDQSAVIRIKKIELLLQMIKKIEVLLQRIKKIEVLL